MCTHGIIHSVNGWSRQHSKWATVFALWLGAKLFFLFIPSFIFFHVFRMLWNIKHAYRCFPIDRFISDLARFIFSFQLNEYKTYRFIYFFCRKICSCLDFASFNKMSFRIFLFIRLPANRLLKTSQINCSVWNMVRKYTIVRRKNNNDIYWSKKFN